MRKDDFELIAHYKTVLKNLADLCANEYTHWNSDKEEFENLKRSYLHMINNYIMMFKMSGIKRRDIR